METAHAIVRFRVDADAGKLAELVNRLTTNGEFDSLIGKSLCEISRSGQGDERIAATELIGTFRIGGAESVLLDIVDSEIQRINPATQSRSEYFLLAAACQSLIGLNFPEGLNRVREVMSRFQRTWLKAYLQASLAADPDPEIVGQTLLTLGDARCANVGPVVKALLPKLPPRQQFQAMTALARVWRDGGDFRFWHRTTKEQAALRLGQAVADRIALLASRVGSNLWETGVPLPD